MKIKSLSNYQLLEIAKQQRILEEVADISYQIYFEKIDWNEFWDRYMWKKLESSPESV